MKILTVLLEKSLPMPGATLNGTGLGGNELRDRLIASDTLELELVESGVWATRSDLLASDANPRFYPMHCVRTIGGGIAPEDTKPEAPKAKARSTKTLDAPVV